MLTPDFQMIKRRIGFVPRQPAARPSRRRVFLFPAARFHLDWICLILYLAGPILQICLQSLQKLDSVTLALFNNAWVVVGKEVGIPAEGTRHVACICVCVCACVCVGLHKEKEAFVVS